jgi:hypothetical protein
MHASGGGGRTACHGVSLKLIDAVQVPEHCIITAAKPLQAVPWLPLFGSHTLTSATVPTSKIVWIKSPQQQSKRPPDFRILTQLMTV